MTDKIGKPIHQKVEVGPVQNTLLGETAPPTSQFVRFIRVSLANVSISDNIHIAPVSTEE